MNHDIFRNSPHSRHVHSDWLYLIEFEDCLVEDSVPTKDDLLLSINDMYVKTIAFTLILKAQKYSVKNYLDN